MVSGFTAGAVGGAARGIGMGAGAMGFQHGGIVPYTGLHLLHAGETVIPKSGGMNIININMNSGPISSGIDVSNMLDSMASRMLFESRRRGA